MKTNFANVVLIGIIFLMILSSCKSHEKKVDDAFDIYKEDRNNFVDSSINKKTVIIKTFENSSEWYQFKTSIINKIRINESKIKEIKGRSNSNSNLLRKAKKLEDENNRLMAQIEEYQEELKVKLENFKMKMNNDLNEIAGELKDLK
jgi:hypothetical protein